MRWWTMLLAGLAVPVARPAAAQDQESTHRITVRVREIAGSSMYLDVGTQKGIVAGDTLPVLSGSPSSAVRGRVVVMAATGTRSVLTFAGPPFPVTRGESLVLQLPRGPAMAPPPTTAASTVGADTTRAADDSAGASVAAHGTPIEAPAAPVPTAPSASPPSDSETSAQAPEAPHAAPHGSVSLDVSAMRSTTQVGNPIPASVARTFATPTMGLDLTVPRAVGPLSLNTDMYLSYRYSSGNVVQPAMGADVFAANLEGDFRDFRFTLGRFYSPMDSYTGFWDGLMLRAGGSGLGVGAMAGFEPNLLTQRPSLSTPKAALFVDGGAHGQGWSWSGNLTGAFARPNYAPDHMFFSAGQRFSIGPVWLSHDMEIDRNPTTGRWTLSQLYVRASVAVTSGVQVHAGFSRSEPWLPELPGFQQQAVFGPRSDQLDAGLSLQGGGGFLSADVFTGTDVTGSSTRGATGSFAIPHLPDLEHLGLSASVSTWDGAYGTTLFASPSVILDVSGATLRVGYQMDRAKYLGRSTKTNGADLWLDAPLAGGLRLSGRLDAQFGGLMNTQSFEIGLYRFF